MVSTLTQEPRFTGCVDTAAIGPQLPLVPVVPYASQLMVCAVECGGLRAGHSTLRRSADSDAKLANATIGGAAVTDAAKGASDSQTLYESIDLTPFNAIRPTDYWGQILGVPLWAHHRDSRLLSKPQAVRSHYYMQPPPAATVAGGSDGNEKAASMCANGDGISSGGGGGGSGSITLSIVASGRCDGLAFWTEHTLLPSSLNAGPSHKQLPQQSQGKQDMKAASGISATAAIIESASPFPQTALATAADEARQGTRASRTKQRPDNDNRRRPWLRQGLRLWAVPQLVSNGGQLDLRVSQGGRGEFRFSMEDV